MITYFSASDFYKKLFGKKVYKISLDAGCTCPTRDGTKGIGGCIFCSASGSGDFASSKNLSIKEQVEQAKKLVENKLSSKNKTQEKKYIAYFQNFTNTYGNQEELLEKFTQAINQENIVGLAIGTRPDCLSNEMIKKISELRPSIQDENQEFHISI
jgi:radical SAM protein (TIGR01212 family)